MKSVRLFLVLGIAVVALAYLVFSSPNGRNRQSQAPQAVGDLEIGEPVVFQNLAIFPVSSKMPRNEDRFITLDEGLAAATVEIVEAGAADINPAPAQSAGSASDPFAAGSQTAAPPARAAAPYADPFAPAPSVAEESQLIVAPLQVNSVNQLMVVNRSEKPLYLMPGEIVIGGSQDRVVGQELVVAPNHQPTPLDVYCVEHGRWGGRTQAAYAEILTPAAGDVEGVSWSPAGNLSLSVAQAADVANAGKFIGSVGSLNAHGRLAVQKDKDQQKVWDEVARQNAKSAVSPATGTFTSNYSDRDSIERLTPFVEQLRVPIDETKNIVGVIVAVDGEVTSMDVFESTPLFRKLWPKLLKSYAIDAANAAGEEQATKVATRSQASAFMQEVANAKSAQADDRGPVNDGGAVNDRSTVAVSQRESDQVLLFSAHERRTQAFGGAVGGAGMGGMGLGGMPGDFDGAIHASGFAK